MTEARIVGLVCGMQAERRALGDLAGHPGLRVAVSGARSDQAERAARRLLAVGCTALVSWGIAGALAPGLAAGDLLVPGQVRDGDATRALAGGDGTLLLGSDEPVTSAADKAGLHAATGALAVDMETHRLARVGEAAAIPVHAIRAVADTAEQALPPLVLGALDEDGRPRIGAVLAGLVRRPGDLTVLLALRRDTRAALAALADEGRARLAGLLSG